MEAMTANFVLSEMAVLRYRPDFFVGEFVNVGLLMAVHGPSCLVEDFHFAMIDDVERIAAFFSKEWDAESWRLWHAQFNSSAADARQDFKPGAYQSFEALRDRIYRTTSGFGSFFWAEVQTEAIDSLPDAFATNFRQLVRQRAR
jgi:hypothetical protein